MVRVRGESHDKHYCEVERYGDVHIVLTQLRDTFKAGCVFDLSTVPLYRRGMQRRFGGDKSRLGTSEFPYHSLC